MLLDQSNISPKNIGMAMEWSASGDAEVAGLANLVAEIGSVHPRRKKRLLYIERNRPELWKRMVAAGLVHDWPRQDPSFEEWQDRNDLRSGHSEVTEELPREAIAETWVFDDEEIPF